MDTDLGNPDLSFEKHNATVDTLAPLNSDQLLELLKQKNWNWFSFIGILGQGELKSTPNEVFEQLCSILLLKY